MEGMQGDGYHRGIVTSYDPLAAHGYIRPDDPATTAELLLFHNHSLRYPTATLESGDRVIFCTEAVPRGLQAADVHAENGAPSEELEPEDTVAGEVVQTNYDRAFGFIKVEDGRRVFFHVSSLLDTTAWPPVGTVIECGVVQTVKGFQARDIRVTQTPHDSGTRLVAGPEVSARNLLAQALLARDNRMYDQAASLYERGLMECPSLPLVLSYAAMERNRNRKGAAMRVYEKGIGIFPSSPKLREDAGILAASLGDYNRALNLLDEAHRICRSSDRLGEKGILLALARTWDRINTVASLKKSVECYEAALKLFGPGRRPPDHDLLAMNVAKIRTQHHRGNVAVQFFRAAGLPIVRAQLLDQITTGGDLIIRVHDSELAEAYGIAGQLLVRCMFKSEITLQDLQTLDTQARTLGKCGLIDEQVILLVLASVPDNLEHLLFKRIEDRTRNEPAIIPLPQSVIDAREEPMRALRGVLDRWLYRRDLFSLNSPVVGRRFFGRTKPIAELREAILSATPTGVFGLRKVGKTSLLKEIERRSSEAGDLTVYMDLLRVPADISDTRWLYWKLATHLRERHQQTALPHQKWRLGGVHADFLDIPTNFPVATAFDADLTNLLKTVATSSISPRPKVVVLLDEVERLLPTTLGKPGFQGFFDFFSYLRGVCQESQDFVLIITGANTGISDAAQFEGRDNPVFNFFKEVYLQLLEPNESSTMIRALSRGMGIRFSEEACAIVHTLTGGHPFFTRQLCSFVAGRYSERPLTVKKEMIDTLIDHYLEVAGKDFREILERFARDYREERDVCVALAEAEGSISLEGPIWDKYRRVSLRHLIGYQIVRIQDGQVYLTMDLLRRWLLRGFNDA
jgi:cold shock CspA family protein